MINKNDFNNLLKLYKLKTGSVVVDAHELAQFAKEQGVEMPEPKDPLDQLAENFTRRMRQETRTDDVSGKHYRAYQSFKIQNSDKQLSLWVDIDDADRNQMKKAAVSRREQMVSDGVQLRLDLDHWNRVNEDKEPIEADFDLSLDIEWRINADDDYDDVA